MHDRGLLRKSMELERVLSENVTILSWLKIVKIPIVSNLISQPKLKPQQKEVAYRPTFEPQQ